MMILHQPSLPWGPEIYLDCNSTISKPREFAAPQVVWPFDFFLSGELWEMAHFQNYLIIMLVEERCSGRYWVSILNKF